MIEFAQPFALWTGLAISLPVLAHLAFRRIARRTPFSTLRFLRSFTIPRKGLRKPTDLLLLLVRLLMFIFLTLLLADPYWSEEDTHSSQPSSLPETLFVLDCTPSMAGWGAWSEALQIIKARLQNTYEERIGLLASAGDTLVEWPVGTSIGNLEKALDQISPQPHPGGIQAMIDRSKDLFMPGNAQKKVVIVSDFQKSSWQSVESTLSKYGIAVEFLPVGQNSTPWSSRIGNLSIVDARISPLGEDKIRVWAAIRNWDDKLVDLNISIFAGGEVRQTVEASLTPLSSEQVRFVLPSNDFAQAVIRLENQDAFSLDNNLSLWIVPPSPRTFGFWTNESSENQSDNLEKQFLKAALESAGDGVWNRWQESPESANEIRLGLDGSKLNFLLVPGLSGWFDEEQLSDELLNYLNRGGIALLSPAEDSHVRMNRLLKESNLLNFTLTGFARTPFRMDPFRIGLLDEKSDLSKVFSGDSARDLYLSQILRFVEIKEGNKSEVLMRDRAGKPLLLARLFPNGGRLVFSTFRLIPQWTDLPVRNSFLPLLIEICGLNQNAEQFVSARRLQVGELTEWGVDSFVGKKIGLFQKGEHRIEVFHPLSESMPEVIGKGELLESLLGPKLTAGSLEYEKITDNPGKISLWGWIALVIALLVFAELVLSVPRLPSLNEKKEGYV